MALPEGIFYENLVCIVLIIGLRLDIMKKSLTTRESTYMELIFCPMLKACTRTEQLQNAQNSQKRTKIRDFEPRLLGIYLEYL